MFVRTQFWSAAAAAVVSVIATVPASAQVRANPQVAHPQIANPQVTRAVDMFLKIEGVDGESAADGHKGWIDVESWSWGEPNRGSSAQRREPVSAGPGTLRVVARMEKSSPTLTQACNNGRSLGRVVVHTRSTVSGNGGYNEYVLEDTAAGACSRSTSEDRPTESISFNFAKVRFSPERATPRTPVRGLQSGRD